MSLESALEAVVTDPQALAVWAVLVVASLVAVRYDLAANNAAIPRLMRWVWTLTVLYSGPLGLALYWFAGRTQIPHDSPWRRGVRSVAHCYSGCGAGEVLGVVVTVGVLSLGTTWVVAGTFTAAYAFGMALTVGPLLEEGMAFPAAFRDAVYSETASITAMEATAIGVDLWLAGEAAIGDVLFWSSLVVSLTVGLVAAYPVNLALIHVGVKEGMGDPAEMG
ncbi:DUF4396 domain-containing protein [Halobaculum sp. D14]|uniref:DUF4396 domain-containing protein n=1 Tax=unclassified Halobaculum TaxID=2640896 RepID=UPI003EC05081